MPLGKDRLYVALYARGGRPRMPSLEDRYHWAFIVGPKHETTTSQGSIHHVKNCLLRTGDPPIPQLVWEYHDAEITMAPTPRLRVRVMIRKINDKQRLVSILRNTPIRGEAPGWNCVEWLKETLGVLERDRIALRTSVTDWKAVREAAMWYVEYKEEQGRFDEGDNAKRAATWDVVGHRELVS